MSYLLDLCTRRPYWKREDWRNLLGFSDSHVSSRLVLNLFRSEACTLVRQLFRTAIEYAVGEDQMYRSGYESAHSRATESTAQKHPL